ncbi:hypothetical protein NECAME_14711 [Necator americanus]|uniref:Uncharacterized protein n=1 Tax=Necator americanus TaxID=51031 RepID=W2SNS6_NECAM|nr:hypothetical protein NECAME_14711 [Necator americanus]ETN70526.1 hypothetical protein NECAME_14711 [Necator americanus]
MEPSTHSSEHRSNFANVRRTGFLGTDPQQLCMDLLSHDFQNVFSCSVPPAPPVEDFSSNLLK